MGVSEVDAVSLEEWERINTVEQLRRLEEATYRPPKTFTSLTKMFEGGHHMVFVGMTGSGKTTLLLKVIEALHEEGHRVLYRDDGGREFKYLMTRIPMVIWVPEGCDLKVYPNGHELEPYEVRQFKSGLDIIPEVFSSPTRFHVLLIDQFYYHPSQSAPIYADILQALIFRCMRARESEKLDLVFSIDELNDLVQPKGHELTRAHAAVRALVENNIKKFRKHHVTLIASTHRLNWISVNVRSQFSYTWFKRSAGKDVYEFINRNLVRVAPGTFWHVVGELTSMGPEYVYLFDPNKNFDRFTFSDIPRPDIDTEATGLAPGAVGLGFDDRDVAIAALRARGLSIRQIAERVDLGRSAISNRIKKMKMIPVLAEVLE